MTRALACGTLVVAALFASGCGGDNGRLSAAEFREQANAVCEEYDGKIDEIGAPTSPDEIGEYVDQAVPILEEGIGELRALQPPEDLQAEYDRMLAETEKAVPTARDLAEAAASQDEQALQEALEKGEQANAASDEAARALGLETCASDG